MRPEIRDYHYEPMMGGVLKAAAGLAHATPKEYAYSLGYIPYFRGIADSFISQGETGARILSFLSHYYDNILAAKKEGKKLAMTSFSLAPVVLQAMDIVPVAIELLTTIGTLVWQRGMADYMDAASEAGLPETSCSAQRGALGAYLTHVGEAVDFVLCNTPGACDTNANAFAFAAAYLDKPFYHLSQPSVIGNRESDDFHCRDYRELVAFLEKQTQRKMDWDRLAKILEEVDRQDDLVAELEDMQLMVPNPLSPIFTLFIYAGQIAFCGHSEYTAMLRSMVKQTRERAERKIPGLKSGKEKLRAVICYIDHYTVDTRFWSWMDSRGISHIGIMAKSFRDHPQNREAFGDLVYNVDTSSADAMLNSAAQISSRTVMIREMRGPFDAPHMWLEETLVLAGQYEADFFLFNTTLGCRNTWSVVKLFAKEVERRGYPIHIMNNDAWDDRVESWEMTRERLDEFLAVRGLV